MKLLNLKPTLSFEPTRHDLALVLQLLETSKASGTLRSGQSWLRLRDGLVVKASGDFGTGAERAIATLETMLDSQDTVEFRGVLSAPHGDLGLAPTALLLEVARVRDEAARGAA